jgi:tetratricopeptide (TPR) repeat protein
VWRGLRAGPSWRAGLSIALIAYLSQQLVLFPLAELEPIAWLLAGIVVAWESDADELIAVVVVRPWRAALAVAGAIALVAGSADVAADRAARRALRASAGVRIGSASTTGGGDRAARLRPDAVRYRLVAARVAATKADALRQLDAAQRLSPGDPIVRIERARLIDTLAAWRDVSALDPVNAAVWLRRGVAAADEGDVADAERSWLMAEDLAPLSAVPAIDLSRLYLDQGRVADARAAAQRAVARSPGDNEAIAAAAAADRALG